MHDDGQMKAGSLVPEAHDGPHRGVELPGGDALAGHEEGVRHHVGVGSVQLAEHLPGVGVIILSVVTAGHHPPDLVVPERRVAVIHHDHQLDAGVGHVAVHLLVLL